MSGFEKRARRQAVREYARTLRQETAGKPHRAPVGAWVWEVKRELHDQYVAAQRGGTDGVTPE